MNDLINTYSVDLSLRPMTFDFWHVCLAATVLALMVLLIGLLLAILLTKNRQKQVETTPINSFQPTPAPAPEPSVKIIEKIIEVEKPIPTATPEPVILKEYTPDAALQVLALLQKEARFIDFIMEDITTYNDADVGNAARVVHQGCNKAIKEHFSLATIRAEKEGSNITLAEDFDASEVRLTGHIVGSGPFTGTLVHKGWQVTDIRLPKLTQNHNTNIVAAAEIEL